eukprot:5341619-Amphidinium_carterae.1
MLYGGLREGYRVLSRKDRPVLWGSGVHNVLNQSMTVCAIGDIRKANTAAQNLNNTITEFCVVLATMAVSIIFGAMPAHVLLCESFYLHTAELQARRP